MTFRRHSRNRAASSRSMQWWTLLLTVAAVNAAGSPLTKAQSPGRVQVRTANNDLDGPDIGGTAEALNKIGSEILAHRKQKIRQPGISDEEHSRKLIHLGLDLENLDSEDCALYVRERLSDQEIGILKKWCVDIERIIQAQCAFSVDALSGNQQKR